MELAWDRQAVDASTTIKKQLEKAGTPISANDTAKAGHAIAADCVLVSNISRELSRVSDLELEDWVLITQQKKESSRSLNQITKTSSFFRMPFKNCCISFDRLPSTVSIIIW